MQKPNKIKAAKSLARGKKKAQKELKKKRANKIKAAKRKADNIQKKKDERETYKMQEEIRKIQNKGLTFRKSMVKSKESPAEVAKSVIEE